MASGIHIRTQFNKSVCLWGDHIANQVVCDAMNNAAVHCLGWPKTAHAEGFCQADLLLEEDDDTAEMGKQKVLLALARALPV